MRFIVEQRRFFAPRCCWNGINYSVWRSGTNSTVLQANDETIHIPWTDL